MTSNQPVDMPQDPAGGPNQSGLSRSEGSSEAQRRRDYRGALLGTFAGVAVLALIASVALAVSGRTISIANAPAPATSAPNTPAPAATATAAPSAAAVPSTVVKVITRWRTRTVTSSAMAPVMVPDPTGSGTMDQGWQSTIPCVYVPAAGLLLGDAGAAAGAVNETCTLTVVQLQPSAAGQALILTDSSGHHGNFALSAAG